MATTSSTSSTTSSTSSSSVTSTLLSALGGGSGINMASLAEQLSSAQYASRIDQLSTKYDKLTTQISAASTLKSMISSLATSLGTRVRTGDLAVTPTIANASVATVTKGTLSGSGTYSLEVTSVAKSQTLSSPVYAASTSTVGSGTLTLKFGTVSGSTFTEDTSHSAVDITVPAGATLSDVATAINASGAGVTAYVANGSNGAQLVLKGKDGAANGFVLEASENASDPGLSNLAWSPSGDLSRLTTTATDAVYKLDGVQRTSTSNTITDAAPGLTLKLTGTNTGSPTTIGFSDPTSAISTAMTDLVDALNSVAGELKNDTDPNSGALNNDPGARSLQNTLTTLGSTVIMPNAAAGAPKTLSDLGLKIERDGTFSLDSNRLSATLANYPSESAAMFTNGLYGVYASFDKISRNLTSAVDPSSLTGTVNRLTAAQTKAASDKSDLAAQQETLRQQMVSRFASLDTRLSASKSTLSFLQAQISAWNSKSSSG